MARAAYEGENGVPSRPPFPLTDLDVSWAEALQRIADAVPDRVAVDDGTEAVTYAELSRRINRVAHAIATADDDADRPIAVIARQGVGAVVAFLAPIHAGRISAPMDAGEPAVRLQRMLDASGATTILTERRHLDVVRALGSEHRRIITIEDTGTFDDTPPVVADWRRQGFVVFTSGSTGTPKGVLIAPENLVREMTWQCDTGTFPLDARVPLITSLGFSAAIGQVVYPLFLGSTICPFDLPSGSARALAEWARAERVTTLSTVPSLLRALAALDPPVPMPSVTKVFLSGETAYGRDIKRARAVFGDDTVFVNTFGSTEVYTVASHTVGPGDDPDDGPLPVGALSPGVTATVVDVDTGEPVPDGEPGRLVAVVDFMSREYWQDPELTEKHYFFAPDGRPGFRSSDLVRFLPDGTLEHLGRLDARVKVRGAMVSTSEVERALVALDDVADAAVVGIPAADGGMRLAAYVVGDRGTALSASNLRRELAQRVTTTMLPSSFVVVEGLPRTVRGKVDMDALPPLPLPPPYREPVGKERELAELFGEVLGIDRVGVDDDFFDLGGDSLAAVELITGISERFGLDVPSSTLLDAPTVGQLASRLGQRRHRSSSTIVPLRTEPERRAGSVPERRAGSVPERRAGSVPEQTESAPLFCVTGGGAPALSLRALADALDTRPLLGIQARGLEERALPDLTVVSAAKRAIREIRAGWPKGPYALAGYSFGALVAFEAARRMEADGQDSGVLVILDGIAPRRTRSRRQRIRRRARQAVLMTTGLLPRPGLRQYERFLELSVLMAGNYIPRGTYGGALLLVRTHLDVPDDARGRFTHRDFGWSSMVTGPITIVDVPGDHLGVLRPPVVAAVADALRETLA